MASITRPILSGPILRRSAILSALPIVAGMLAGLAVAGLVTMLPDWRLEALVEASGLPRLLPPAQPPLGTTARGLLALGAGGLTGAVIWSALFLLVGPGGLFAPRQRGEAGAPVVRRADAHPDAPPRRPLSAADLGTPPAPPQEVPAPVAHDVSAPVSVRDLPADLGQPLAAFDPQAIPVVPREPVRPVRPVRPVATPEAPAVSVPLPDEGPTSLPIVSDDVRSRDRIETFELTPMVRRPERRPLPDPAASIEALLERLERGTRRPGGA